MVQGPKKLRLIKSFATHEEEQEVANLPKVKEEAAGVATEAEPVGFAEAVMPPDSLDKIDVGLENILADASAEVASAVAAALEFVVGNASAETA